MIKVLVVAEHWWPDVGGGILATHLIAKLLAQHGYQVTIVTGTNQPAQINGVKYATTAYLRPVSKVKLWLNVALLERTSTFRKMIRDTDILYIPRYCYPLIPLARRFGKKVIVHLHDYQPMAYNAVVLPSSLDGQGSKRLDSARENLRCELMEHGRVSRAIASTLLLPSNVLAHQWLKEADDVVCVSTKQAEIITGKLNIDVKVIYNPLPETPPVTKEVDLPCFLYTGGTSYLKGVHILLKASKKFLENNGSAKFLVTKGFRGIWDKMLAGRPALASAYQILGWMKYKELQRLHSSTLALIFPSVWEEPLPYTVSEAMLHGTIPLASKLGGVSEIVEGSYAEKMLFQPGNIEQLVDRMESTLSMSNEQITNVGLGLRKSILKRFNRDIIESRLTKLFLP